MEKAIFFSSFFSSFFGSTVAGLSSGLPVLSACARQSPLAQPASRMVPASSKQERPRPTRPALIGRPCPSSRCWIDAIKTHHAPPRNGGATPLLNWHPSSRYYRHDPPRSLNNRTPHAAHSL